MAEWWWIFAALVTVILLAGLFVWAPLQAAVQEARLADMRRNFHLQRERLEARFIQLAAAKSSGFDAPQWADCEFDNDVAYVRNRSTHEMAAFVGITVMLQDRDCLDTPDQDDSLFRLGTAVFRFKAGRWETEGQALLNLSPSEAVLFYQREMEVVAQEMAP